MKNKTSVELSKEIIANYEIALNIKEDAIRTLLLAVKEVLQKSPSCVKLTNGSALVIGDIHGDFEIMKKVTSLYLNNEIDHLIFLGDIVDRGQNSIACLNILFSLIIVSPSNVHIVRGNHEALSVNSRYGFFDEVINFSGTKELYELYNEVFSQMPLALLHEKHRYFFVHGGIPDSSPMIEEISALPKGDVLLTDPMINQLLWNDPKEGSERLSYSLRGDGIFNFGEELAKEFMSLNGLRMIIRAHEAFEDGYKYFFDKTLLSLFSSEEYYEYVSAKIAFIDLEGTVSIFHPNKKITF